jgi:hypothetical protein
LRPGLPKLEAFDGQFGPNDIGRNESSRRGLRLGWLALLLALSAIGAVVFTSPTHFVERPLISWSSVISGKEAIVGASPDDVNDQIVRLNRERDVLQGTVKELTAAQEQAASIIASLEAQIRESREPAPSHQVPPYWYSVPSALLYRPIDFAKATSIPRRKPVSSPDSSAPEPGANAPLPRVSPQQ